jgi:hypothetical protein
VAEHGSVWRTAKPIGRRADSVTIWLSSEPIETERIDRARADAFLADGKRGWDPRL